VVLASPAEAPAVAGLVDVGIFGVRNLHLKRWCQ
jgi:hypothetical protein